jgi:phosphate transport system ATP-binding protein
MLFAGEQPLHGAVEPHRRRRLHEIEEAASSKRNAGAPLRNAGAPRIVTELKQLIHADVTDERAGARASATPKLSARRFSAFFGDVAAVKELELTIPARHITSLIGGSGSGKSTFLRCLNRMHELTPGARVRGWLELDGQNVYGGGVDPVLLRRRVGMVFEKANTFPTMSIRDNLLAGYRLSGLTVADPADVVERTLHQTALWAEVGDRLDRPASILSTGQQQRLCIARALALDPDVLLLDEPCAGLDPAGTARIEGLMVALKERITLVLVTHNLHQAARVSDLTAFFHEGSLVEVGPTSRIFTNPADPRTEDYVTGRAR